MIAITLNFKTLEAARQALLDIPANALVGGPEPEEAKPAPKPRAAKAAPAETPAAPAPSPRTVEAEAAAAPEKTADAPSPAAAPAEAAPPASTAVDYPTLQKAVFALAGKSREAAASVAASFGVKTFKELDASKWGEALAAVNAKLAEV